MGWYAFVAMVSGPACRWCIKVLREGSDGLNFTA